MVDRNYEGKKNLEIMDEAVNYNSFILSEIMAVFPNRESKILDFGAGRGVFAKAMREQGYQNIMCLEPDPLFRQDLQDNGFVTAHSMGDIPDNTLDGIYAINVLEHISEHEEIVRSWFDKLRGGAKSYAYVPAFQFLWSDLDTQVGHVRRYNRKGLETLFKANGFLLEQCSYADSAGIPATLYLNLFKRGTGEISSSMVRLYDRYFFPLSRIADKAFRYVAGKNVHLTAQKPPQT
jgi:hypothetical protein